MISLLWLRNGFGLINMEICGPKGSFAVDEAKSILYNLVRHFQCDGKRRVREAAHGKEQLMFEEVCMRKVVSLLLLSAMIAPAMALTFSLSDQGGGVMRISYDLNQAAGEGLRGLALTVVRESGDAFVAGADDFLGGPFNTFIDYAGDVDNPYYELGDGHPFALITPDVVNGQYESSFPTHSFTLSMGYLDPTGGQGAIMDDGCVSVTFTGTTESWFRVGLDPLRGGAMGDNLVVSSAGLGLVRINPIPEPMTLGLLGLGISFVRRRR